MQTIIRTAFIAALLCGGASMARAESLDVKIPFPFVVHGQTLPAGEYRVETNGSIVMLRGEHGNKSNVIFMTTPADAQDPGGNAPVLTFKRGETQYRLEDIWESTFRGSALRN